MKKWIIALSLGLVAALPAMGASDESISQDSINSVIKRANAGDGRAENIVGSWYYTGQNLEQNYTNAFKWWGRAAKHDNVVAIGNLGLCYHYGKGVDADSLTAIKLYKRSIEKGNKALLEQQEKLAAGGNALSAMLCAECYDLALGTKRDLAKSAKYLEIAADKGSAEAMDMVGLRFLNAGDDAAAAKWLKLGCERGNISSTYYYGKMLLDGKGVDSDVEQGFNYILKAARDGFPAAQYAVGVCYDEGTGVTANLNSAYDWILKSAQNGYAKAQFDIAKAYADGKGRPVNYEQALVWLTKCADNGYARRIAAMFKDDEKETIVGTPFYIYAKAVDLWLNRRDFNQALAEVKLLAKTKNVAAKTLEGLIMADKANPTCNAKKAVKLLKDAAKIDPVAMFELGKIYETGATGVAPDAKEAIKNITESANAGYARAQCYLGDMYYEGREVKQDYAAAVDWYRKAAAQSQLTESAAKRYAACFENGYGGLMVNQDKAKAILEGKYADRIPDLLKAVFK